MCAAVDLHRFQIIDNRYLFRNKRTGIIEAVVVEVVKAVVVEAVEAVVVEAVVVEVVVVEAVVVEAIVVEVVVLQICYDSGSKEARVNYYYY